MKIKVKIKNTLLLEMAKCFVNHDINQDPDNFDYITFSQFVKKLKKGNVDMRKINLCYLPINGGSKNEQYVTY